jgi:hypothetical protein
VAFVNKDGKNIETIINTILDSIKASSNGMIDRENDFIITDKNGNIGMRLSPDGFQYINKEKEQSNILYSVNKVVADYKSDVIGILNIGNSVAVSYQSVPFEKYPENALFLSTKLNTDDENRVNIDSWDADKTGYFTGLRKATGNVFYWNGMTAKSWSDKLSAEQKITDIKSFGYDFLTITVGAGGTPLSGFVYGTNKMGAVLASVESAKNYANQQGKSFSVATVSLPIWGDYTFLKDGYDEIKNYMIDVNTRIKLITGQNQDIIFFVYQGAAAMVPINKVRFYRSVKPAIINRLAKDLPNVYMGQVTYWSKMDNGGINDGLHPSAKCTIVESYKTGILAQRLINNSETIDKIQLYPKSINSFPITGGYLVKLNFNVEYPPLTIDLTGNFLGSVTNYGFRIPSIYAVEKTNWKKSSDAFHTLSDAILLVPISARKINRQITFISSTFSFTDSANETAIIPFISLYRFNGIGVSDSDWLNISNWVNITPSGTNMSVMQEVVNRVYDSNIITSVAIKRGTEIQLTCSDDPKGLIVEYATKGNMEGGNIRDSMGNTYKTSYDATALNAGVFNWMPIFYEQVN